MKIKKMSKTKIGLIVVVAVALFALVNWNIWSVAKANTENNAQSNDITYYGNSELDYLGQPTLTPSQTAFYGDQLENFILDPTVEFMNSGIIYFGETSDNQVAIYSKAVVDKGHDGNYNFDGNNGKYSFYNVRMCVTDKLITVRGDNLHNAIAVEYQTDTKDSDKGGENFIFTFNVEYLDSDGQWRSEAVTDSFVDKKDGYHHHPDCSVLFDGNELAKYLGPINKATGQNYDSIAQAIHDGNMKISLAQLICDRTD